MYSTRFRKLVTKGYALANKWYFDELSEAEFDRWVEECKNLLSSCKPEPDFPWFPDHRHIEEIVMLLQKVLGEILRGQRQYLGVI